MNTWDWLTLAAIAGYCVYSIWIERQIEKREEERERLRRERLRRRMWRVY